MKPIFSGAGACAAPGSASATPHAASAARVILRVMPVIVVSSGRKAGRAELYGIGAKFRSLARTILCPELLWVVRLAQRGWGIQADRRRVARDDREHDDRRHVRQHGEQL